MYLIRISGSYPEIAKAEFEALSGEKVKRVGKLLYETRSVPDGLALSKHKQREKFVDRRPHLRPFHKPVSLHPQIARAMVNLLGPNPGRVHDPCCGTGGIVIEGLLQKRNMSGADLDPIMVNGTKQNLSWAGVKGEVWECDVFNERKRFDCVVTDLPYGLRGKDVDPTFYYRFFHHLLKICLKKAVIAYPSFYRVRKAGWRVVQSFSIPLHKSLKKRIVVVTRE